MRWYLVGAGLHGASGVAMGAWAAHGLQATLSETAIGWVRTAASYQLWHAAALVALGAAAAFRPTRLLAAAGWAMGLGALVFAGALYVYALAGATGVAMLAPVGGSLMVFGWLAVLAAGFRVRAH